MPPRKIEVAVNHACIETVKRCFLGAGPVPSPLVAIIDVSVVLDFMAVAPDRDSWKMSVAALSPRNLAARCRGAGTWARMRRQEYRPMSSPS
jgi:hypothetical protein